MTEQPAKKASTRKKATAAPVKPVEAPVEEAVTDVPAPEPEPVSDAPRRSERALSLKRALSQGDRGEKVQEVQTVLADAGLWDGPIDGRYGSALARSVRQFQDANGLKVTGEVNVQTWEAMA